MNALLQFDSYLTLLINGWHTPFLDQFFFVFSRIYVWIPLYLAYIFLFLKNEGKKGFWIVLSMIILVVISDQISSGLLKPLVERLRPSHDPLLADKLHFVNGYVGGLYGFVSSHAANTAGLALFLLLVVRNRWHTFALSTWVLITGYSRVYLGVHFVGDVVCGALVGVFSALVSYYGYFYYRNNYLFKNSNSNVILNKNSNNTLFPVVVYGLTLLVMLLISV
jgi:undecaprenyl-diphosphatase